MGTSKSAKAVKLTLDRMKAARSSIEAEWQDVKDLVRPYGQDFNRSSNASDNKVDQIYDGTAPEALEQLAAGLHSFLTNPVDQWCSFGYNQPQKEASEETKLWLQDATNAVHAVFSNDASCFHQSVHEVYLDMPSFGTGFISQEWSPKLGVPKFRSHATASCWIEEDYEGSINTVYRQASRTLGQLAEQFGTGKFSKRMMDLLAKDPNTKCTLTHGVEPRSTYNPTKRDNINMPYGSYWVVEEYDVCLKESGYDELPYHPARWVKLADEVYGRSPAMKCLPDIRMLNAMERTIIRSAQKIVDPPLAAMNDDALAPLSSSPGSVNYVENMDQMPRPILTGGNVPLGLELTNQKREHIRAAFYSDWIRMEKQNVEMTATEVIDRRDEKLRLLAPVLGRLQAEFLGPMVARTLKLLIRNGKLTKPPEELAELGGLAITYISPAAQAQVRVRSMALERFFTGLLPLAQLDPTSLDAIKLPEYVQEQADLQNVPRRLMRSPEEMKSMQEGRAKQQQAQQLAQVAEPASQALKNVADARAKGLDLSALSGIG